MEILKPRLGLGRFLNVRITRSSLGCNNSITFKCRIRIYASHSCLCCTPISCGIQIYPENNNNQIGRTSNVIGQYIMVEKLQVRISEFQSKQYFKASEYILLGGFRKQNNHHHKNCIEFPNVVCQESWLKPLLWSFAKQSVDMPHLKQLS